MDNIGNKLSNDYWEYKMPKNYRKPTEDSSPNEVEKFVTDKYIRKLFVPDNFKDPVKEYTECKKNN